MERVKIEYYLYKSIEFAFYANSFAPHICKRWIYMTKAQVLLGILITPTDHVDILYQMNMNQSSFVSPCFISTSSPSAPVISYLGLTPSLVISHDTFWHSCGAVLMLQSVTRSKDVSSCWFYQYNHHLQVNEFIFTQGVIMSSDMFLFSNRVSDISLAHGESLCA